MPESVGIRIQDVDKTFSGRGGQMVTALQNINLEVSPNEFLTVVGPSGCGKTTLLRILAGLEAPEKGRVLIGDREITGPDPAVSVVFQQGALFPWRSVRDNIALGIKLQHHRKLTSEESDRVDYYTEMVGLSEFRNNYPMELSGGMQQRVGLARALARQPKVLLMDEPFGALDAQTRAILQEELQRLWETNRMTVFFITHDIDEAIYLSDRVVLMSRRPGRIKSLLQVDFSRPRYEDDPRSSSEFGTLHQKAWASLREELTLE